MKRLAIFDFDGTLFDSIHDVLICFNKALAIHDFPPLTREELIPCLGGNIGEIVALVLNENNTPKNVEEVKRTYLDLYYSSDKELTEGHNLVDPSKPHPCGVQKIIKKAKVLPEDAIYIGDSKTDIATAENAGIDCIIVKWGYGNEKDWQNEYILESVDDMCEIPKYF